MRLRWLQSLSQASLAEHVAERPADAEAALMLARSYLKSGRPDAAEQVVVALLERGKGSPEAWLLRSQAEFEGGKLAPAFASLQVAMPFLQDSAEAHHRLGLLLERRGDEQKAEAQFRRAVALDSTHVGANLWLGESALAHRHYQPALEHLEAVLRQEPRNPTALELLSMTHRYLGNLSDAERYAREATAVSPDRAHAWLNLAQTLQERATPAALTEAEKAYQRALQLEPGLSDAHFQMGKIRFEAGAFGEAARELQKAVDLQPLNRLPYPLLIQCYLRLGQQERAKRLTAAYDRVNEMDLSTAPLEYSIYAMPHNTALRLRLARLYLRYKRPDLASEQISKILEQNPGQREALQLQAQLKKTSVQ